MTNLKNLKYFVIYLLFCKKYGIILKDLKDLKDFRIFKNY